MVIGEAALRQEVGGPEVMEGQLGLLAGVSGDSGVITVQILPFSSGAHAGVGVGSLAILQFLEVPRLGVVHPGGLGGGVCLERQEDLVVHACVFEQLRAFALSPAQSARLSEGRRPYKAIRRLRRRKQDRAVQVISGPLWPWSRELATLVRRIVRRDIRRFPRNFTKQGIRLRAS